MGVDPTTDRRWDNSGIFWDEKKVNENSAEFVKVITRALDALESEEIEAGEGAELCRAAARMLRRIKHLLHTWWARAAADGLAGALEECAEELESM
jgi:hypothetical protein